MQSQQTGQPAIEVVQWVAWADRDYVAARTLFLSGSLVQGCALSATAIEKYLKGILTVRGVRIRRTHDVVELYRQAKSSGNIPSLSEGYLRTLVKAYKLRYPDDLTVGFNISLAQAQLLTELDATVYAIRKGFCFQKPDGSTVETRFDSLLKSNDGRLTERNAAFTTFDRPRAFAEGTECYELRVISGGGVLEASYRADVKDTGEFECEGLKPGTQNP